MNDIALLHRARRRPPHRHAGPVTETLEADGSITATYRCGVSVHSAIVVLLWIGLLLGTQAVAANLLPFPVFIVLVGVFGFWWGYYDEGYRS